MPLISAPRPGELSGPGTRLPEGLAGRLRNAAPALVLFAAIRAVGLAVLMIWSEVAGRSSHQLLSARWDSLWYVRVADYGYGFTLRAPDGRNLSSTAFFPLYPWSEKGLSELLLITPADAGLAISALASLAAAWGMFAVAELSHSRRAGIILAGLWAALPVGIVQSMGYSESLFVALATWSLYALLSGRWLMAGSLAFLAGLTRPVGLAVSLALISTALPGRTRHGTRPVARHGGRTHMVVGCALAPLGAVGYILWVGQQQGSFLGYLDVQAEWGNGFDGGIAFSRFLADGLGAPALTAPVWVVIAFLVLWPHRIAVKQRLPLPLVVYCAAVTVLAVGASGYFGSKPRLLLPAFPLLLPLAIALARARRPVAGATLTTATAVAAAYGAFWLHGSGPP